MGFGLNRYELRVVDNKSNEGFSGNGNISTGVLVVVYDAGTKTVSTIYGSAAKSAKSNPITRAQFATDGGKIAFFSSAASVDIFVADDLGNVGFVPSVTPNDHVIYLDKSNADKCLVAPFGASETEVDTGVDFPLDVIIKEVLLKVTANDAGETLNVGILSSESGGDADGLLALASVASTGIIKPVAITAGTTETYVSTFYYGALMGRGVVGTNVDGDFGLATVPGHVVTGSAGRSLAYTGSSGSDTAAGLIYAYFRHL